MIRTKSVIILVASMAVLFVVGMVWYLKTSVTDNSAIVTSIASPSSRAVQNSGSGSTKLAPKGKAREFVPIDQVPFTSQADIQKQPTRHDLTNTFTPNL